MPQRNTQQRRNYIIDQITSRGEVSVEQLSAEFNTSEVTIRKDLNVLENEGKLLRRYGGAVRLPSHTTELLVSQYKQAIAQLASQLIKNNSRIVIDSGNTTSALVPLLAEKKNLLVMTNSLKVANQLLTLEPEPTLLMPGGTWDPISESFQGKIAEQVLEYYDFDQLFIGADGLDLAHGTTSFHELLTLSRAMAKNAHQVIVMLEADKIGRKIPNIELTWDQIDILITDDRLDKTIQKQITKCGVQLLCATLPDSEDI
ncbi:DeoR/GlpR family DNA-binding transcription regulator [Entomomonas asaccharolytica]|uniref:DeoR family transcriptional regulator n=1 Tax=Entomomonas asaccharolytica TaxID=2785331 RepID=A0A974RXJ1_9GAMM|nr:DeoR family transcriptional regulator [Entomomonas asaccharolytica]QQP86227.1 DeoR family transcriptional regulator [Entomomonas asaccharolytica]